MPPPPACPFLTIAIPTFNRPKILLESVRRVLAQLDNECSLLVVDNASPIPVCETLQPLLDEFPNASVSIQRNGANIGCNANIMRCFEYAQSEWLWLMGDDDFITPGSIQIVKNAVREASAAVFVNFVSDCFSRVVPRRSVGLRAAIQDLDNFGNLLFISTGVYRRQAVIPMLRVGCHYTYSCAPHVALLFSSLDNTGQVEWRTEVIVQRPRSEEESAQNFSVIFLGLPTLIELPMDRESRRCLMKKITAHGPSLAGTLAYTNALTLQTENRDYGWWLFGYLRRRLDGGSYSAFRELAILVASVLLRMPRLCWTSILWLARIKGTKVIFEDSKQTLTRL